MTTQPTTPDETTQTTDVDLGTYDPNVRREAVERLLARDTETSDRSWTEVDDDTYPDEKDDLSQYNERVYDTEILGGRFILRFISTVDKRDDSGRKCASDSFKIGLLDGETMNPVMDRFNRCYRVKLWRKNVRKAFEEVTNLDTTLQECDNCGHYLHRIPQYDEDENEQYHAMVCPKWRTDECEGHYERV